MTDNYAKIVQANLKRLYDGLPADLSETLPARREKDRFMFDAFGRTCTLGPGEILLDGESCPSVLGILISLYALNARPDRCIEEPFRAFKEFPDSMPYVGAFITHTQQVLVPHVPQIGDSIPLIREALNGSKAPADVPGDFSFVVRPLPKISLCYIFYQADDDFPASVTCLFSQNARIFLPVDGLADVGEYSSRKILEIVSG